MTSLSALCNILLLLPPALAHMEMIWPYALRSSYNPDKNYTNIDYSMTDPLLADGSNFPCKGYQNDASSPVAAFAAGRTYNMSLAGTITHGGGSCQLSLSYDSGATFRVIKSMIGGCPLITTYDFTIPTYAPSGSAFLAWTWQNLDGDREFYMNCAAVQILSPPTRRRQSRRQVGGSWDSLPYLWKANLVDVNDCATVEGEETVYPNPGPDAVYGAGVSSDSTPAAGNCDTATGSSPGVSRLAQDDPVTQGADSQVGVAAGTSAAPSYYATPSTTSTSSFYQMAYSYPPTTSSAAQSMTMAMATQSTTTLTVDCPDTVTVTITPSAATTTLSPTVYTGSSSQSASGFSTGAPPAPYPSPSSSPMTSSPQAYPTPYSTVVVTSTAVVTPVAASSTTQASAPAYSQSASASSNTAGHPPYADANNLAAYLPCVPGTFICTDISTWYTCDYTSSNPATYGHIDPRQVSTGMSCITFVSPYSSSTQQYAQQAQTQQGHYRDDRMVRSRPDGDCSPDGSVQCTNGGQGFEVCDQGGWVDMGMVAQGTMCSNAQIVSSS